MVGENKPLHGLMVDGKFQFGHYKEFTPMNLFSEELKLGIQSGMYEYKFCLDLYAPSHQSIGPQTLRYAMLPRSWRSSLSYKFFSKAPTTAGKMVKLPLLNSNDSQSALTPWIVAFYKAMYADNIPSFAALKGR